MLSTLPVFLGVIIPVTESFVHPLETAAKIKSTALIFLNTGITIVIEGSIYSGLKMAMEEKKKGKIIKNYSCF